MRWGRADGWGGFGRIEGSGRSGGWVEEVEAADGIVVVMEGGVGKEIEGGMWSSGPEKWEEWGKRGELLDAIDGMGSRGEEDAETWDGESKRGADEEERVWEEKGDSSILTSRLMITCRWLGI
jgi:hypothetical protein